MQFTSLNTVGFADIPEDRMSGANAFFSMANQMTMGMGIAFGAVALRLAGFLHPGAVIKPTVTDFHIAFGIVGLVALAAVADCFTLAPDAGANVSGHRRVAAG